jgi:hypothetical protein
MEELSREEGGRGAFVAVKHGENDVMLLTGTFVLDRMMPLA